MKESLKPIKEHLQDFLDYCEIEKGLRDNTQENYKNYLEKFFLWMNQAKLESLLPHQLTPDHIWAYRLYLSRTPSPSTGKLLGKATQNYYLIALRAFLGYFAAKDVLSLPPDKIALPGAFKREKTLIFLTSSQIEGLLNAPKGRTPRELRDKALLHTIVSTGLKVRQISELKKDSAPDLPKDILTHINEYLKTRLDDSPDLFINYRNKKTAFERLTPRSIERIIKAYGELVEIDFPITPEYLRSAKILATWNKEIKINGLLWQNAEEKIKKEISWLKENISVIPERYRSRNGLGYPFLCDECVLRKLSILIVSGTIKADLKPVKDFWPDFNFNVAEQKIRHHGKDWHKKMMDLIIQHYHVLGRRTHIEPVLNYGRADIGIIGENDHSTYFEVGTVSIFKIWYNLMVMPNTTFILVPNDDFIIKFQN